MRFAVCPLLCISIRYWLRTEIQTLTSAEDRFSTGAAGFVSVSKVGLGACVTKAPSECDGAELYER